MECSAAICFSEVQDRPNKRTLEIAHLIKFVVSRFKFNANKHAVSSTDSSGLTIFEDYRRKT